MYKRNQKNNQNNKNEKTLDEKLKNKNKKKNNNNNDCTVMLAYLNTPVTNLSASPNHLSMSDPALIFMNVAPHSCNIEDKKKKKRFCEDQK